MKLKSNKLSTKILVFVCSVSFILIIGSFGYFYYSGQNYLSNLAKTEIENFKAHFEQACIAQLIEISSEIESTVIEQNILNAQNKHSNNNINQLLQYQNDIIEELYSKKVDDNSAIVAIPIIVFSGELIINSNKINVNKFDDLEEKINIAINLNNKSSFGNITTISKDYYIITYYNNYSVIAKINKLTLFDKIIKRIYHSNNINFSISGENGIVECSTIKQWTNQNLANIMDLNSDDMVFSVNSDEPIILGIWENEVFDCNLIISNNIVNSVMDFHSILFRVLFYSMIVLLIISIMTYLYSKKISKSLNEVSKISLAVGAGNFTEKISISRDDELGLLINSFNKMIDNLRISYQKLSTTNIELEEKINELSKTRIELTKKQKLALIGETISKISHEIQNKISGVSVWVQNLEMQGTLDHNTMLYVKEIKSSLNSFVQMLLNFKKFYRKPYLEKHEFDLKKLVQTVISIYEVDIDAKGIKIIYEIERNIILNADENLIEEMILNLFVNALYFSPENGCIKISIYTKEGYLIFSVEDEGIGIKSENKEAIFNPFFTTKSSGSGLGLAISKNIVEAHNGTIEVNSIATNGTQFIVRLPINEDEENENTSN